VTQELSKFVLVVFSNAAKPCDILCFSETLGVAEALVVVAVANHIFSSSVPAAATLVESYLKCLR
jgi:hypothetical protein